MKKIIWIIVLVITFTLLVINTASSENLIVSNAISELGNGETDGNNKGPDIKRYNNGYEGAWCAGFVSYILKESNIGLFEYSLSAKAIYNEANRKNRTTTNPQAGDLIVFHRGNPKSWQAHIGIIEKVDKDYIYTIEGNVGKFPAVVKRFKYKRNDIKNLIGFIDTSVKF
jgi:hypothetical protein